MNPSHSPEHDRSPESAHALPLDSLTEEIDSGLDLRSISRAALVTAAALALPVAFHALRLGHVFLPMYLPILAGACFLRPGWAALTGGASPLVSAALTGMPPIFPPVALWMAIELAAMAWLISTSTRNRRIPTALAVGVALVAGRGLYAVLIFATGRWLELPAGIMTLVALLAGWPGMLLAITTVPLAVTSLRRAGVTA